MKRIGILLLCICLLLASIPLLCSAFETDYAGVEVAVGNVTLPLPEYPIGSKCEEDRYYPLPDGRTVDVQGWECIGFARYVFYRCFGVVDFFDDDGRGYYSVVFDVKPYKITEDYLKGIFGVTALPGAHIRASDGENGHSMVYLACDETYIYTYEGNYDHNNGVTVNKRTWDEFALFCQKKGGIRFIHMPDNYPAFGCLNCPGANYKDMPAADNWAHAGLDFVLANKLFVGTTDTTVSPAMQMSRAMLVTVLWRMAGQPEAETAAQFSDVKQTDWFASAVAWAAQTGVVSGIGDGTFRPNQTVTREQIAAVMHRYLKLAAPQLQSGELTAQLGDYADGSGVSGWAREDMAWAIECGLISGKQQGEQILLDALAGATRAEVATVIQRFCALLGD